MSIYKIGDIVEGRVTGIESYGIFMVFDDGTTGLIHISEISETFVRNVSDYVKLNEIICAKILDVDLENKKLKLSIKDLNYRMQSLDSFGIVESGSGFFKLKSLSSLIDIKS